MTMKTLAETLESLRHEGFTESFQVRPGRLVGQQSNKGFRPSELKVEAIYRFEGETDPSDMSILFALSSHDGDVQGTWAAPFGSAMGPDAASVARDLGTPHDHGPKSSD